MEMLFEGFDDETKEKYQDNHGMYLDVCGCSCIKCDDDERVVQIELGSETLSGSLELCYVPPKVKVLLITSWRKTELTGSVDLTYLPSGVEWVDLDNNELTHEIDLTLLPDGTKYISLQANQLSEEIELTHLPDGMEDLYHNKNHFTGNVVLTHLPKGMQKLFLQSNLLSGSVIIKRLPHGIEMIDLRENNFNAIAVVTPETDVTIKLDGSGVTPVVDEKGEEINMERFMG